MRKLYGAGPIHLLGHATALAVMVYALAQLLDTRGAGNLFLWLIAAAVLHDLVVVPAYSALDRAVGLALPARLVNFLRVPFVLSAALFVIWFPAILGLADGSQRFIAARSAEAGLGTWLAVTAVLFAVSGLAWVVLRVTGRSRA